MSQDESAASGPLADLTEIEILRREVARLEMVVQELMREVLSLRAPQARRPNMVPLEVPHGLGRGPDVVDGRPRDTRRDLPDLEEMLTRRPAVDTGAGLGDLLIVPGNGSGFCYAPGITAGNGSLTVGGGRATFGSAGLASQ